MENSTKKGEQVLEILEKFHPSEGFKFPLKIIGQGNNEWKRSCQFEWFKKWDWLHYSIEKDSLFCFLCNQAHVKKKLFTAKSEKSFIYGYGFSNWKHATGKDGKLNKHQNSDCHKDALIEFSESSTTKDIGAVMPNEYREKEA